MAVRINRQLVAAAKRHIVDGVPMAELGISADDRNRIERVKYMRFLAEREPGLKVFEKFKRIAAGRYDTAIDEWKAARKDLLLYDALRASEE